MEEAKIYALVDPRNKDFFYIGASTRPLDKVAYTQMMDVKHGQPGVKPKSDKFKLINELLNANLSVEIVQIDVISLRDVPFYHQFYVDLFRSFGFNLMQHHKVKYSETYFKKLNKRVIQPVSEAEKRKRIAAKLREKINSSPLLKAKYNSRGVIYRHLKKGLAGISNCSLRSLQIIGCNPVEFVDYLKGKLLDGMTFENYGLWHIDHLIPIDIAKDKEEVYKLNHYLNLQPLWAEDNRLKKNKIIDAA